MSARERILAALDKLGSDELELVALIAERAAAQGRHAYGELVVATDPRRFEQEALLEVADGLFYVAAGLLRVKQAASQHEPDSDDAQ